MEEKSIESEKSEFFDLYPLNSQEQRSFNSKIYDKNDSKIYSGKYILIFSTYKI